MIENHKSKSPKKPIYHKKVKNMRRYAREANSDKLGQELVIIEAHQILYPNNMLNLYGNLKLNDIKQSLELNKRLKNIDVINMNNLDDLTNTINELDQIEIESRKNNDYEYIKKRKNEIIKNIHEITDFLIEDAIDTLTFYAEEKDLAEYLSNKIEIEAQINSTYEFYFNFSKLYTEIKQIEDYLTKDITEEELHEQIPSVFELANTYFENEKLEEGLQLLNSTEQYFNNNLKNKTEFKKRKKEFLNNNLGNNLARSYEYAEKTDLLNMEYELNKAKKLMTYTGKINNKTLYSIKNTGYKETMTNVLKTIKDDIINNKDSEKLQKSYEKYIYARTNLSRTALQIKDIDFITEKDKQISQILGNTIKLYERR